MGKNPVMAKICKTSAAFYKLEQEELQRIIDEKSVHFKGASLSTFPLIKRIKLIIKQNYMKIFEKAASVLLDNEPDLSNRIKDVKGINFDEFKKQSMQFLYKNYIDSNDQLLLFLMHKTYRPLLNLLRKRYGYKISDAVESDYRSVLCPVCGGSSDIGYLNGKGVRILVCLRCDMKWRYCRTGCALCGTKELNKIDIYAGKDIRVYHCKVCSGNHPIIDMREKFGEFEPEIERAKASIVKIE